MDKLLSPQIIRSVSTIGYLTVLIGLAWYLTNLAAKL
jgi:hypothetical protein